MTGPTREEVEEWAKRAKLPKHMRDTDAAIDALMRFAAFAAGSRSDTRPCTCHPDDNPPKPCPKKYALSECRAAGEDARDAARYRAVRKWLVSDDPPRYLLESYPVTEDAVDVVIDAAMGGNDA